MSIPPWTTIEVISSKHDIAAFCSGLDTVDFWFHNYALQEQEARRVHTKVCVGGDGAVLAFFSLRHIVVEEVERFSKTLQKSCDPLKTGSSTGILLAQMGRDLHVRSCGKELMREIFIYARRAHDISPYNLFVVDAASQDLISFYEKFGFALIKGSLRLVMKASTLIKITDKLMNPSAV